jgi:hypothetical protein
MLREKPQREAPRAAAEFDDPMRGAKLTVLDQERGGAVLV